MIRWKLDTLMRARRLKGRALAQRMGIGENYLSRVRHDAPDRLSLSLLDGLCRELNCSIAELLEYVPDPPAVAAEAPAGAAPEGRKPRRAPAKKPASQARPAAGRSASKPAAPRAALAPEPAAPIAVGRPAPQPSAAPAGKPAPNPSVPVPAGTPAPAMASVPVPSAPVGTPRAVSTAWPEAPRRQGMAVPEPAPAAEPGVQTLKPRGALAGKLARLRRS